MSELFDELKAALEEAIAYTKGEPAGVRLHEAARIEVSEIRKRLGLSQSEFASVFGVSVGTVRNWEQHRRDPTGVARVLLTVIDREPEAVIRALHLDVKAAS